MTWHIGDIVVRRLEESVAIMEWDRLVPGAAKHVSSERPWIDPYVTANSEALLLSIHSFVVQTPKNTIVVDTCIGPAQEGSLPGDAEFGERIARAFDQVLESVDVVVCTHLHFDHVGWNTIERDGEIVPLFPNARYLVSEAEFALERDAEDTAAYDRSIAPLDEAGVLDVVASNHRIDEWVSLESTPGHTPGHVSVRLRDGDHVGLITGDIVHSPIQLAYPKLSATSDADPPVAVATRRQVIAEALDSNLVLFGTHFPPPTAGWLRQTSEGVRFITTEC